MESTLTQNGALYFAQHKVSKQRAALFRRFATAAKKQRPDVWQHQPIGDLFVRRRLHCDNGR
ncbi:MAG: hypothetical protein DME57_08430 [Verrucomicrobia bacterium]|nr:MAG: hypothetical protein DME57_08430 [Verrucomicrobiota bacterium]